jgi:hypothetical protein
MTAPDDTGQADEIPIVKVFLSRSGNGRYWRWIVRRCDLCGSGPHIHGGGEVTGDPRRRLSYRVAHCALLGGRTAKLEYQLVDANPDSTARLIAEAR